MSTSTTARWAPWSVVAVTAAALAIPSLPIPGLHDSPQRATAAGPNPIISTFYVPLFEDNAYNALESVNSATNPALSSTTSVTVAAGGTLIYYDHWEDGYEATADTPAQGSSLILGDGTPANGDAATYCVPARCAGDVIPTGAVLRLNNSSTVTPGSLAIPRSTGTVVFDGRDKISSTGGIAVAHATWPTNTNALHSEMSAAFDTSRWGVNFVAPVGTNTPRQNSDGQDHFSYSGIEVMAKAAGTVVSVDANNDGDYADANDVNGATIGEGQTVYVNGGIQQGARVVASKPVQTFMMTGRIGSNYEDRSFQLFPTEGLVNDYIAPASTASAADAQATVLYIYNPQSTSITVTVTTSTGSTDYTVAAGSVLNPAPYLGVNRAARVTSSATFAVIGATGTRQGAQGQDFDWGYSLVPARLLSTSINVGWAPGSQDLSTANYDPVWVTTTGATTLYVDYDGDPTTGPNLDPNGGRYDADYAVAGALNVTKVTDTSDNDMTGAHIYTTDDVTFAAAFGEDPSEAPLAFPGIDLGTALFPSCGALCVQKSLQIITDVDGDGQVDPGDTIQWTVKGINTGYNSLSNAILKDVLPGGVTYVAGSTTVNGGAVADDVVPPAATPFPYDENGRSVGDVGVGGDVIVRFKAVVNNPYDGPSTNKITNTATMLSDEAAGGDASEVALDTLRITKTSNGTVPVTVGQNLSYTITVSNSGGSTLTTIPVNDVLPGGLTWNSTTVTRPVDATYTIADDFQSTTYAGSSGTASWAGSWTETNDSGSPNYSTGQVRNVNDGTSQRLRIIGSTSNTPTVSRLAGDLTGYTLGATLSFDYKRTSLESGDAVVAEIRPNGSASWTTLGTYTNGADTNFVNASFNVAASVGAATEVRFRVSNNFDQTNDVFFVDNVTFTLGIREPQATAGTNGPTLYTLPELRAGESATLVVSTTVASIPNAEIFNTATATSGTFISKDTVNDCAICFDYGDAPASYDSGDAARARVTPSVSYASATIADTFQTTANWTGSTGTVAWSANAWTETDSGGLGTTSGNLRKETDLGDTSVRWRPSAAVNTGISRVIGNLTGYSAGIVLTMERRCNSLEADDVVALEIRKDASSSWQTLKTWSSCTDTTYQAESFVLDLTTQIGSATELRYRVTTAFESGDDFFLDNVQLALTTPTYTLNGPVLGTTVDRELAAASASPGGAPTGDDTAGTPTDEEGVTLPSVDTDTLTIPFTVTDPTGGTTFVNGWFDWNNNGVFDAAESIFSDGTFVSGTNGLSAADGLASVPGPGSYSVTITVPDLEANGSGFSEGESVYARFRVATSGSDITAAKARGLSSDGEVEDYRTVLNTLPVSIAYVTSTRAGKAVTIAWRTSQEVDNAGFDIWAGKTPKRKLTSEPIASVSPKPVVSQEYSRRVRSKGKWFHIEDIALDGSREMHGPYRVGRSVGDPDPDDTIDWSGAEAAVAVAMEPVTEAHVAAAQAASQDRAENTGSAPVEELATFAVDRSGIQQVTFDDLLGAGVDLTGVAADDLALVDPAGPVPIAIDGAGDGGRTFGPGSTISFVGEALDTLYTGTNVYRLWIDPARALRVTEVAGLPPVSAAPLRTYPTTTVLEPEATYSVTAPGDDPWFDTTLLVMPGFSDETTAAVARSVAAPDAVESAPARADVRLFGLTEDDAPDQHVVSLLVNGVAVASTTFDDLQEVVLGGPLPDGVLQSGDNTLEVVFSTVDGVLIDLIAVDSWKLSYTRSTVAADGRIDLAGAGRSIGVSGLPAGSATVYRVIDRETVASLPSRTHRGTLLFAGTTHAQRYLVATDDGLARPAVSPARPEVDLLGGTADYLVIASAIFDDALAPLVAHHESLGRTVRTVDPADVYDAYSSGVFDAAAIDAYLAEAVPALGVRWVLLVGSDTIDYRDHDDDGSFSLLPSLYGETGFNIRFAPLDPEYADLDGDGVPDVALGRMPARTPEEMVTMVAKTLDYATHPAPRSAVLASDANDGLDYAAMSDDVESVLGGWDVARADLDRVGVDEARSTLLDSIDEGVGLTMYLGHSGTHDWTEQGLFDAATAAELDNEVPTVVAQFGCWNTYYVTPEGDTLGQVLMSDPVGGAAAVLGSTTLTSAASDGRLAHLLAEQFVAADTTLGEALLAAKQSLAAEGTRAVDVLLGWTMMGDPALVVGGTP